MRNFRLTFLFCFFAACASSAYAQPSARQDKERTLKTFLQQFVRPQTGIEDPALEYKQTRYLAAFVDLKDDGVKRAIVILQSRDLCGSGGCTALILEPAGVTYRIVTELTITRPPIRVLSTKSNGWHDLTVFVTGGGILPGYDAILSFDGESYPGNPSSPPARKSGGQVRGITVIPATAESKPLFP